MAYIFFPPFFAGFVKSNPVSAIFGDLPPSCHGLLRIQSPCTEIKIFTHAAPRKPGGLNHSAKTAIDKIHRAFASFVLSYIAGIRH